jgi:putative oxidoreductase
MVHVFWTESEVLLRAADADVRLNRLTAIPNRNPWKSLRHNGFSLRCRHRMEAVVSETIISDQALHTQPMQRLADKLTALVPPAVATPVLPQPSPAVAAALARSAEQAKLAAKRASRSRRAFVAAFLFLPYSVVALALRVLIARVFFLDGQMRIEGLRLAYNIPGFDFHGIGFRGVDLSVIVPTQVKVSTVAALFDYLESAMLSTFLAHVLCFAEFALPIMLVLGIGTRFVALGLLGLTVLMQLYIAPQALWTAHIYWGAILVVLMSLGAGKISVDHIVRLFKRA